MMNEPKITDESLNLGKARRLDKFQIIYFWRISFRKTKYWWSCKWFSNTWLRHCLIKGLPGTEYLNTPKIGNPFFSATLFFVRRTTLALSLTWLELPKIVETEILYIGVYSKWCFHRKWKINHPKEGEKNLQWWSHPS